MGQLPVSVGGNHDTMAELVPSNTAFTSRGGPGISGGVGLNTEHEMRYKVTLKLEF